MSLDINIGLPEMHLEAGEKRAFLPAFVADLADCGFNIFIEHGYGAGMGFSEQDYRTAAPGSQFCSLPEAYQQDIIIVLRYPGDETVSQIRPGACLMSMLHYPTRPNRVAYLQERNLQAISFDSIKDDIGKRLIENLRAVSWNGIEVAFQVLKEHYPSPGFEDPNRLPIKVTVMGAGAVGTFAVQAAIRYGNQDIWHQMATIGATGVQVTVVDYDVTNHPQILQQILKYTDILVDATQRVDLSVPVIRNEWIALMRPHAVLLDLSVDPYETDGETIISTKGIEGIPQGSLDQYVFAPDDPAFDRLPAGVHNTARRHVVSCYSWPGIYPRECMDVYGKQLSPVMHMIANKGGVDKIDPNGAFFERAAARASLRYWNGNHNHR